MTTKQLLHSTCQKEIEDRIGELKNSLQSVRDSKNQESKSSVGDKYETSRAMMQIEEERLSRQLSEVLNMKMTLGQIDPNVSNKSIQLGSIFSTHELNYFVSVPIGKVEVESKIYYCVSVHSPIGALFLGKKSGEIIDFNGKKLQVLSCS
ncbi:MAG: 3-oxoacyl-ACP synthase [Chitinophagales bacterium]|nr:3-oxoacyl-ACP synthase [Chitinophagales bacterium]